MLDGVLEKFIDDMNATLEPMKEKMIDLETFSLYFLLIGFLGSFITSCFLGYLFKI